MRTSSLKGIRCGSVLHIREHIEERGYRGLAPDGKKHTVMGAVIYRIVNGKVVEAWVVEDTLDSLKQLGVIRYTEKAKKLFPEDVV